MYMSEDEIQAVVEVLEKEEQFLSDGYEYYCGKYGGVKDALRKIAIEIITQLDRMRK